VPFKETQDTFTYSWGFAVCSDITTLSLTQNMCSYWKWYRRKRYWPNL